MRYGWRGAWTVGLGAIGALAAASSVIAARHDAKVVPPTPSANGPAIRLTVEIDWTAAPGPIPPLVLLSLSEGRILAATAQTEPGRRMPEAIGDGTYRLGKASTGRVRARLEAPLGATLTVTAGPQETRIPLSRLLDGPQRTVPPAAIEVGISRVAWDTIEVDSGDFDGTPPPGAKVPLRVGLNVLSTDSAEVNLRLVAELKSARTGAVVWQHEQKVAVATDSLTPPSWSLMVPMPDAEGLYTLDLRATWEPNNGGDGSRLGRFLRRRKAGLAGAAAASRTMSLVVVDSAAKPPGAGPGRVVPDEVVDSIDLARPRGHRPSASGRSPGGPIWRVPEAALIEETRRDRLRGWIARGGEPVALTPVEAGGMAWSAVGLKVPHPDRPHRLTVTVPGGHPSSLGVGLIATGGPGGRPRVVLDACVSGPPLIEGNRPQSYSWIVWPEAAEPALVLVNRNPTSPVQIGGVTLTELADLPAVAVIAPPGDAAGRVVGLDLTGLAALDRFGGRGDPLVAARNLVGYLDHCGATTVVLPDTLADRNRRQALDGQAEEDALGPDRLDLMLAQLARRGLSAWVDLAADGVLRGLPSADSPEALGRGLVRVDRAGKADGPTYQTTRPEVREAMARRVAETAGLRRSHPSVSGLLVRLGPGSTLLGRPDTGLDDATFAQFVAEMFDPGLARGIPGLGLSDAGRFEARARFIEGAGQKPWLAWRARELAAVYAEMAEAARRAAPGVLFAVATPDLDAGAVGEEVRRLDRLGLGPAQAWRSVGLDLTAWTSGDDAPIVLRGIGLSSDEMSRDLATSPELDEQTASRRSRGLWLGTSSPPKSLPDLALFSPPLPACTVGDEPLGHAVAAIDGQWYFASADAVAGREDGFRRFAQVVRSLPAPSLAPAEPRPASGVAARLTRVVGASYFAMANDTPYPIQLEAAIRCPDGTSLADLGRTAPMNAEPIAGGLRVVVDLPPFAIASARIDTADTAIASLAPRPGAAVLDGMKAQYDDLAVTLARLNRLAIGESGSGPMNADFEAAVQLASSRGVSSILGWQATGDAKTGIVLDPDHPHAGRSSLRVDAIGLPGGAVSDPFIPSGQPSVTIHAWLRADRPETRVRLWLEGQAAGRPFARQLEVSARPDWSATAVRASGIPATGLESARIRFEMLTPGRLWLDDLSVSGPALTEPERLNARRDLMAALSAYREHRYADFARLAGSHWTRHVASEPAATGRLAGDRSGLIRTGDASSALPPSRRLR